MDVLGVSWQSPPLAFDLPIKHSLSKGEDDINFGQFLGRAIITILARNTKQVLEIAGLIFGV